MKKLFTILFLSILLITCKDDDDPCDGVTCQNGGECKNGTCDCPENYEGADCSDQKTPSKITITKIEVTKFPATEDNGAGWDLTSGPDIFFVFSKGTTVIDVAETYFENATQGGNYKWDDLSIEITSPKDEYTIELGDYDDTDDDDFMGGVEFTPYSDNNEFPEIITLNISTAKVNFRLQKSLNLGSGIFFLPHCEPSL